MPRVILTLATVVLVAVAMPMAAAAEVKAFDAKAFDAAQAAGAGVVVDIHATW